MLCSHGGLKWLGLTINPSEIASLISVFDTDGDGTISYFHFPFPPFPNRNPQPSSSNYFSALNPKPSALTTSLVTLHNTTLNAHR